MNDPRRSYIDKLQQRTGFLDAANKAYESGDQEAYKSNMEKITNLNSEITAAKALMDEQERTFMEAPPDPGEEKDRAEERAETLKKGGVIKFSALEVRKGIYQVGKSVTLATGTLAQPTGAGANIRDPLGNGVSSIVDQVYVQNLTGMNAFLEPYAISETDAKGGKVSTNAGKSRTASEDPTFGVAKISPYELNTTNYVDRNISRLTHADYYAKIFSMSMRAMRRKTAALIANGDGQASPDMFGIKTAKNQAGGTIYATVNISAINENLLDDLFFSYGSDEAIGQGARLYLTKADLKAIAKFRNGDKERVFKIHPDAGNPNTGTIEDSGTVTPYTILPALTSLSGAEAGAAPVQTMVYGDPINYELGLFGDYSVRVDESIKGEERMLTILGDAMVGGNLIVDKGFVVATLPKSSS